MDKYLIKIYLECIKEECEKCYDNVHNMNAILVKDEKGDLFGAIHYLINHAASISRLFWPPKIYDEIKHQRAQHRGEVLRSLIGLSNDHIIQNRNLRNHIEHFDERLDDWAENSINRNIVRHFVGDRKMIGGNSIKDTDIIDHYDPKTNIYSFRGEPYDIQRLVAGIEEIYASTNKEIKKRSVHN